MRFRDFADFLELTAGDDRQFLGLDELHKFPECVCALANSSGGWVIAGAELDNDEVIICGLNESFDAEELIDSRISHELEDFGAVKAIYVEPLKFHMKPLIYDGKVYRRVEGVNLISGMRARSIMISDAQEFSRDDFPFSAKLSEKSINEFREAVIKFHDEYKNFSRMEFLKRCGAYSGKHLTFAGALMFAQILRIKVVLKYHSGNAELEARNIWSAYAEILPKLTAELSRNCAVAFREIFINSLLHSDYNISRRINITITSNPPKVLISNPGILRGSARNYRLMKMFELSGISRGIQSGLNIIKSYSPNFVLQQDMLNFRVKAELKLEGRKKLPEPVIL